MFSSPCISFFLIFKNVFIWFLVCMCVCMCGLFACLFGLYFLGECLLPLSSDPSVKLLFKFQVIFLCLFYVICCS